MSDHRIVDLGAIGFYVYGTYHDEMRAAAVCRRLNEDEGIDATTADVDYLCQGRFPVRSAHRYAVIAPRTTGMEADADL